MRLNLHKEKSAHAILLGVLGVLCGTSTLESFLGPEADSKYPSATTSTTTSSSSSIAEEKETAGGHLKRSGRVKTTRHGSFEREGKSERKEREGNARREKERRKEKQKISWGREDGTEGAFGSITMSF